MVADPGMDWGIAAQQHGESQIAVLYATEKIAKGTSPSATRDTSGRRHGVNSPTCDPLSGTSLPD